MNCSPFYLCPLHCTCLLYCSYLLDARHPDCLLSVPMGDTAVNILFRATIWREAGQCLWPDVTEQDRSAPRAALGFTSPACMNVPISAFPSFPALAFPGLLHFCQFNESKVVKWWSGVGVSVGPFCLRALILLLRSPPSWPKNLPKAPPPNAITSRPSKQIGRKKSHHITFQHMNWQGTQTFRP